MSFAEYNYGTTAPASTAPQQYSYGAGGYGSTDATAAGYGQQTAASGYGQQQQVRNGWPGEQNILLN